MLKLLETMKQIFDGTFLSLRSEKNQVKEVLSGTECGITFQKFNDLKEKDVLKFLHERNNEKK